MTKRIVITPKASLDIDEYFNYIAQQNPDSLRWARYRKNFQTGMTLISDRLYFTSS
jgi:plasmid stabilization system protein ParE